jgi:hypothetical protein
MQFCLTVHGSSIGLEILRFHGGTMLLSYPQNSIILIQADILPELNLVHVIREIFMWSILIISFLRRLYISKRHFPWGFPPVCSEFITYCTLVSCPVCPLWFDKPNEIIYLLICSYYITATSSPLDQICSSYPVLESFQSIFFIPSDEK